MLQPQNFVQRRLNGPELMNYPFLEPCPADFSSTVAQGT